MKSPNHIPGALPAGERELRQRFLEQAELVPGGDRISLCLQCGTCTGSCPVSYAMDISPRMAIALFRAGHIQEILRSRTIWICASCYMCTTRCPQQIKITDLLYALKRVAMEKGLYPDRYPVFLLSKTFVNLVKRYGRNHEVSLMLLYYLRRNPRKLLAMAPLGLAMYKRGRMPLMPRRIRGIAEVRKMLEVSSTLDLPREATAPEYTEGTVGYRAVGRLSERAV